MASRGAAAFVSANPTSSRGSRIRAAREKQGLSQSELAARHGLTRVAVAQWEADTTAPSCDRLEQIAKDLGESAWYLGFGYVPPTVTKIVSGATTLKECRWGDNKESNATDTGWSFPTDWLKNELRIQDPDQAQIFEVTSDNMAPLYELGDRLIIDTSARRPGNGVFLLWMKQVGATLNKVSVGPKAGETNVIVARIQALDGSDSFELPVTDLEILGKVKGAFKRAA